MPTTPPDQPSLADEAWRLMFDFLMRSTPQRLEAQKKHGLTPNDSRALFSLDADGRPIGMLAREWDCDPSTATWLVDRLERSGLADRVPSPSDRRVKLVRATEKGIATKNELEASYYEPPSELLQLSRHDLEVMIHVFNTLQKR